MKTQKMMQDGRHGANSIALALAGVIGAAVCVWPTVAWSQTQEWTVYNTSNSGLPYNGVTSLAIDAQGSLWIGTGIFGGYTGGGLAKFDGVTWTVYNTSNSGLPHNDLPVLHIDAQGRLWIGTDGGGLAKFDGANWSVYSASDSGLPDNRVYALPFDAQGNLWVGTYGLAKFDGLNWTVYNTSNSGLPSNFTTSVVIDSQEAKWIGTWDCGIARFDGLNWTVYSTSNSGLPHNSIWDLAVGTNGNLWIGTNGGGLARFDGVNWAVYNTGNSGLPANAVHRLAIDSRGNLWMGTSGGLAMFNGEGWKVYSRANSGLPDNGVWCVAFDAEENIWIGTGNGGLAVFRPRPIIDFNGNGSVDINDLVRLIESWGQDDPSCDIGPNPFGDGVVDEADLDVLMSHWGQEVQDGSLKAHWKLDATEGMIASDSAGDNDATVMGAARWQPDGGCVDGALEFDGATFAVAAFILSPSDGPFSVVAWIKGGAPGQVVLAQQTDADWLLCDPTTGALMTELKSAGRFAKKLSSDAIITDGNWHRVGFTWDGSTRRLYVDDGLVAEGTDTGLAEGYGGLNIGAGKNLIPGTFFIGLIDDVRIYNRAVRP